MRSSSTLQTPRSEDIAFLEVTALDLIRSRVLPTVKKAVNDGAKLNSIINTHQ